MLIKAPNGKVNLKRIIHMRERCALGKGLRRVGWPLSIHEPCLGEALRESCLAPKVRSTCSRQHRTMKMNLECGLSQALPFSLLTTSKTVRAR